MRKQNLQKGELDQIGRKLLETSRISNKEIEQIVAAPQLFDAVKLKIKTEQRKSRNPAVNWRSSTLWNWQRISAAAAALAILVFGVAGLVLINKSLQIDEQAAIVLAIQIPEEKVEIQLFPEVFRETAETKNPEIKPQLIAKKQTVKKEILRKTKPEHRTPSVKRPAQSAVESLSDFYALNYMGNPNETGESLRIVRAEMSSSALFALGVNVPIENAREKIKTDLLVGSDGVARAIRFVE